MIILFLLFLVQFAVACACLAVNKAQQEKLATAGWKKADNKLRHQVQIYFNCCGFIDATLGKEDVSGLGHPACDELKCCENSEAGCCKRGGTNSTSTVSCPCHTACWSIINEYMDQALKISGGIGLFFSFTEIIGVWLAFRFRNLKDPRANPSAFL